MQKNSGMDSCHYVRMEGGDWFLIVIDWVNWLSFSKDSRRVVSIATYRALLIMAPKAETIRKNLYIEHMCDQAHIYEWPHSKTTFQICRKLNFLCKKLFNRTYTPAENWYMDLESIIPSEVRQTKTNIIGCYLYVESKNIIQWP